MAILVTGGSGFVGLNVLQRLLERGEAVVNFSLATPPTAAQGLFDSLPGTLHTVTGDVCDTAALERLFAAHPIARVIHAAVITAGPERERGDPLSIVAVNLQGTLHVLEAARRAGVRRFLYPSSGSVYGDSAFAAPELEEDVALPQPVTLYGITKYAAERAVLRYRALHGMDVVAARLGIVFGRWEYATGQRDTLSPLFHLTAMAMRGEEALLPTAGQRDWVYAPDVAAGIVTLLDLPAPRHGVYHVAAGREWSAAAWCERLRARYPAFRYRIAADEAESHQAEPERAKLERATKERNTVNLHRATLRAPLSARRLHEETGFAARFGLEEAFTDYMDWLERYPL